MCLCMCGCTCSEVSTLCTLLTLSMQMEDQPIDGEKMILAFQAEITAHQHFQQEKLSEGGS